MSNDESFLKAYFKIYFCNTGRLLKYSAADLQITPENLLLFKICVSSSDEVLGEKKCI